MNVPEDNKNIKLTIECFEFRRAIILSLKVSVHDNVLNVVALAVGQE